MRVTVRECPNCGAPLDPVELSKLDDPVCPYCERALPVHEDKRPKPSQADIEALLERTSAAASAAAAEQKKEQAEEAKQSSRTGCLTAIAIVAAILAAVGVLVFFIQQSGAKKRFVRGAVVAVAGDGPPRLLALAAKQGGGDPNLRLLDATNGHELWSGPKVLKPSSADVVPGRTVSAVIDESDVTGVDMATGRSVWHRELSADLRPSCIPSCAAIAGGAIAAVSKNGALQAFSTTDGHPLWNKQVDQSADSLTSAGASFFLHERKPGAKDSDTLSVIDPATGALRALPGRVCPEIPGEDPLAKPIFDDTRWTPWGDGSLVIARGAAGACVQGINVADGKLRWSTPLPAGIPNAPGPGSYPQSRQGGYVWVDSGLVLTLDPATGKVTPLLTDAHYGFSTRGITNGVEVVVATLKGDHKEETWGIDVATHTVLWKLPSRVKGPIDKAQTLTSSTGIVIVSCDGKNGGFDKPCYYEAVDPKTGSVTAKTSSKQDLIPQIEGGVGVGNVMVVEHGSQLVFVSLTDAHIIAKYGTP